ncbi:uncharacterized protein LOC105915206 [Setaria italica]|uniref:uncharacterized protein LOC105915206 n=1 Tax=Setaria italica TaxID=4555 RepID=UPI0006464BD0|nr:uncharacterized protein LOC105915206 [Setaria italica]
MEEEEEAAAAEEVVAEESAAAAEAPTATGEVAAKGMQQGLSLLIKTDKAQWTEPNTHLLCDLWVEQIRAGNCHKGTMSGRGYKIIVDKYSMVTGLKHDKMQLRNRINQLKIMYGFWKELQKQSGFGRKADGTVSALEWWWKDNTKERFSECKKLQYGAPEYIDQLEEIFYDVVVDGFTSYLVGFDGEEEQDGEDV